MQLQLLMLESWFCVGASSFAVLIRVTYKESRLTKRDTKRHIYLHIFYLY